MRHHELPALQLMGLQFSQQKLGQTPWVCLCTRTHEVLSHQLVNEQVIESNTDTYKAVASITGHNASKVTCAFEGVMVLVSQTSFEGAMDVMVAL